MLVVHRAPRADVLAAALAEILAAAPADPLVPDVVSVPTRGVERWLSQTLASRLGAGPAGGDGICANVRFPFPGTIVADALARATGVDPGDDPWRPERLVWPLIAMTDGLLGEPWLATLAAHLGHGQGAAGEHRRDRRFTALRHVADLFDRYAVHRPEMLLAWRDGRDEDGTGAGVAPDLAWQAELWRRLRERLGTPGPAERLGDACAAIRDDPSLLELPGRLAVFGLTRLPAAHLAVLDAIAAHRDVHVLLLHPTPSLWERVRPLAGPGTPPPRRDDPSRELPRNPLLASWGRDVREVQFVVGPRAGRDVAHDAGAPPETLLGRLQRDVRDDVMPPDGPDDRLLLTDGDRSVQVHSCHGRARQVEVVRDAVLHLMADDATLQPRDVLVMCPDVEDVAPLVHATFAAADVDPADDRDRLPDLRVRLADRSIRQTNPVLGTVATLLDLVTARLTASQVLDLAGRPPVRGRFGFDDDDLSRAETWAKDTGVRWGLDAAGRAPFRLDPVEANTWRFGLDRLLVGVAVAESGDCATVDGVLPLDDVGSKDIDLAGRLAEYLDRLGAAVERLRGPHDVAGWVAAVRDAADLVTRVPEAEAWQRAELEWLLEDVAAEAAAAPGVVLGHPEFRGLVADRLRGRPTRANFRTGHLTVCTLVPMRSVPHRVVCVMGLDDGAFPRRGHGDGDDILLRDPRVGDRDARGEDRQLLLDALMAARDHLVIVHTGRDERTNAAVPPAVPALELLDVIDRTARCPDPDRRARTHVVTEHPLQPFDPDNFVPGKLRPGVAWGFDPDARDGARALAGPRSERPPFLAAPLDPPDFEVVEIADLLSFMRHPVRAFLRRRLRISERASDPPPPDAFTIDPDGLDRWGAGERAIAALLAGVDPDAVRAAERARGLLPPGALAAPVLDEVVAVAERIVAARPPQAADHPARSVPVEVTLPDGRLVVGTVPGVHGDTVVSLGYSRMKPSRRLAAWLHLVVLTAADPDTLWRTHTVGKEGKGATTSRLAPLPGDAAARRAAALGHLAALVDLHDRGMRAPLPLFEATSAALVDVWGGDDPLVAATKAWEGDWRGDRFVPGENAEAEHVMVFGADTTLAALMEEPPPAGESGPGWPAAAGRVRVLAGRLWGPVLTHEAVAP